MAWPGQERRRYFALPNPADTLVSSGAGGHKRLVLISLGQEVTHLEGTGGNKLEQLVGEQPHPGLDSRDRLGTL